jgi:hypothetical protein
MRTRRPQSRHTPWNCCYACCITTPAAHATPSATPPGRASSSLSFRWLTDWTPQMSCSSSKPSFLSTPLSCMGELEGGEAWFLVSWIDCLCAATASAFCIPLQLRLSRSGNLHGLLHLHNAPHGLFDCQLLAVTNISIPCYSLFMLDDVDCLPFRSPEGPLEWLALGERLQLEWMRAFVLQEIALYMLCGNSGGSSLGGTFTSRLVQVWGGRCLGREGGAGGS